MATIHQVEANRLNAQKSTGPRTANGKAASSRNALKSGIDAKSEIIRGEKLKDLEALTAEYLDRFQPATPEERHYVDTLVRGDWQLRRLARVDAEIWEYEMSTAYSLDDDSPLGHGFERGQRPFERLQRRINAIERSYRNAFHELRQIQAASAEPAVEPLPEPAAASAVTPQPEETKGTKSKLASFPHCPPKPSPTPAASRPTSAEEPRASAFVPNPHPVTPGPVL